MDPWHEADKESVEPSKPDSHKAVWRLIVAGEADGAMNMAVDEAVLTAVAEASSPPTLRFYAWCPACLSLGRNQPLADVNLSACHAAGVDVVRRPTGGRAILHADELTYSVALLQSDPVASGGILESYCRLSEGLLAGLHLLGVQAVRVMGQPKPATHPPAVCFEMPAAHEITVGGRKLVGSAQWRTQGGVLQHGSLPLCGDVSRIVACLAMVGADPETQRRAICARATTLEEALGRVVPFSEAAGALAQGLSQVLDLQLIPGELSRRERLLADELRSVRYGAAKWTGRA